MLEEGIHSLLAGDSTIQGLIGTAATRADQSDGVFPVTLRTTILSAILLPAVLYHLIAGHETDSLDGRGELRVTRVQISSYANDYATAAQLREAAKDAVLGYQGVLSDGTEVDAARLLLVQDLYESTPKVFHSLFDVEIWHRKPS